MVRAAGECVRAAHATPGLVVEGEVKPGQVERPLSLPPVEMLGLLEVLQIFVVGPDLHRVFSALEEMPPLLECANDCEHLLVVDLVVALEFVESFREKGYRMPLLVRA